MRLWRALVSPSRRAWRIASPAALVFVVGSRIRSPCTACSSGVPLRRAVCTPEFLHAGCLCVGGVQDARARESGGHLCRSTRVCSTHTWTTSRTGTRMLLRNHGGLGRRKNVESECPQQDSNLRHTV